MNKNIDRMIQLFSAWSGVYYILLVMIGWWIFAGFVPAHLPSADANEIAAIYQSDTVKIRIGMVITMFGAMMMIPFTAVVAQFIAKIEGRVGILTIAQIMGGMGNTLLTFYPPLWWLINSFRPERSPELLQYMNDAAWLQFVGGLTIGLPAIISVAIAALAATKEHTVFPRWLGFYSLWTVVLLLPGQLIFFFKTGPFAWNGLLSFWMPVTVFCVWFPVMFVVLRKEILRQSDAQ